MRYAASHVANDVMYMPMTSGVNNVYAIINVPYMVHTCTICRCYLMYNKIPILNNKINVGKL